MVLKTWKKNKSIFIVFRTCRTVIKIQNFSDSTQSSWYS